MLMNNVTDYMQDYVSAYFLLLWRCNSEWPTLNTLAVSLVVRLSHDTDYPIL